MNKFTSFLAFLSAFILLANESLFAQNEKVFKINDEGYYEVPGLNVMAFQDFYPDGHYTKIISGKPHSFGRFLRYNYLQYDFSPVKGPGIYKIQYGDIFSNKFQIKKDVYARHVWQPTLGYFLPVQMCHMRVNDRYRVWHGLCHDDDALMAPVDYNHFDGYLQGPSTLTKYKSGDHVPGLNAGGWQQTEYVMGGGATNFMFLVLAAEHLLT